MLLYSRIRAKKPSAAAPEKNATDFISTAFERLKISI